MLDLIKKGVFLGIGLFEETKEKAEMVVDDLIKTGKLAKEERTKAIEKFTQKIKEQEKAISDKINTEIKKTIDKLGIPSKEDFDKLVQEIEELKTKIDKKK